MGFHIISNDVAQDPAIQSVWYDIDTDILAAMSEGRQVVTGCAVAAQGSPDMTVAVAAGVVRNADGTIAAVTAGNLTVGVASGSNPRIDLISASSAGVKTITAGTAAAQPKPPALPAGHIALALVLVGTSDTAIQNAEISDRRFIANQRPLRGTAFPASPASGDVFYRTDLNMEFFWNGTRWLSTILYEHNLMSIAINVAATTSWYSAIPCPIGSDLWLETLDASLYAASAISGTAYWRIDLFTWDGATQGSAIATVNNQSEANATFVRKSVAIGALLGTGKDVFDTTMTKVSTPGNGTGGAVLRYRLVGA